MSSRKVSHPCPDCSLRARLPSPSSASPSLNSTPSSSSSAASTPSPASTSAHPNALSKSHAGTIAGSVVGGVVFLVLITLGALLYLRARKRNRTPPSSEFMNSIRAGDAPVLRLDSGAQYTPALSEKAGGYTHYPPSPPLPSYYCSPPRNLQEMTTDPPSGRPSVEKPLHPQRYSSQWHSSDAFVARHHPNTSVGSRRELWGSDTEVGSIELSPVRRSPAYTDSVLQFAPRFSLNDIDTTPRPPLPSHSPPPLHPMRRQPDPDDV